MSWKDRYFCYVTVHLSRVLYEYILDDVAWMVLYSSRQHFLFLQRFRLNINQSINHLFFSE